MAKEKTTRVNRTHRGNAKKFLGILISGVGFFWLAKSMGWIPVTATSGSAVFWPILTIALGVVFLLGRRRGRFVQNHTGRAH
jgi:drug/metabolite transporter (DMT)-like permease